jgi:hypothetical protein
VYHWQGTVLFYLEGNYHDRRESSSERPFSLLLSLDAMYCRKPSNQQKPDPDEIRICV